MNQTNYKAKIAEVNAFLSSYPWEPRHCAQVCFLSLLTFDKAKKIHQLGMRERFLLEAAALLHDIGFTISASKHHKHSQNIITAHDFKAVNKGEALLIAQIARYHRKALPSVKHGGFRKLENNEKAVVERLSAILRIADGLDRSHTQSVKNIEVVEEKMEIIFLLSFTGTSEIDLYGANKKKDLFEKVFQKKVVFDVIR